MNRKFTHHIIRRYVEKEKNRHYFSQDEKIPEHLEDQLIISSFQFSLHPMLTENYMYDMSLQDQIKTLSACSAIELWKLGLILGIDFPSTAIKTRSDGSDVVLMSMKTNVLKKLKDIWKEKWGDKPQIHKCIVLNNTDIPPLKVYCMTDIEMKTKYLDLWFKNASKVKHWDYKTLIQEKVVDQLVEWKREKSNFPSVYIVPAYKGISEQVILLNGSTKTLATLLQVEVAHTVKEYAQIYGNEKSKICTPFTYKSTDRTQFWNGSWETFYLYCPKLKELLLVQ